MDNVIMANSFLGSFLSWLLTNYLLLLFVLVTLVILFEMIKSDILELCLSSLLIMMMGGCIMLVSPMTSLAVLTTAPVAVCISNIILKFKKKK